MLAQPRIKSAGEIAAETEEQLARIDAEAQLKEAKARANARVRGAQIEGLASNASVVAKRIGLSQDAPVEDVYPAPEARVPSTPIERTAETFDPAMSGIIAAPTAKVSKAIWSSLPLKERVLESGVINATEVAEVLGLSVAHARKLAAEVRASDDTERAPVGRKGVPYQALIDALYARRTTESFAQAQKLEKALGLRKRRQQQPPELHVVPGSNESEDEAAEA